MRTKLAAIILGAAAFQPIVAAAEESSAVRDIVEAAKKEGALTMSYGGALGGAAGAKVLEGMVNKRFGTNLKFTFTPGPAAPEMAARIGQEALANRPSSTDIFFSSITASNAHLFQIVEWPSLVPGLPEEALKHSRRSVTISTHMIGMTYNTQMISPEKAPKSLADLLKPEFKGKVTARVSTTFMSYLALPEILGKEGSVEFFRKLGQQASGMARCGGWEQIASGEISLFFPDCGDYMARVGQRAGAPLGHIIPQEGGGFAVNAIGIPNNSAHPNVAKLLILVLLSPEGQNFIWEQDGTDSYLMPGSRIAKVMQEKKAQGVKFFDEIEIEETGPDLVQAQKDMFTALQGSILR